MNAPAPSDPQPRTVIEPTTGRPVLIAPLRQQRPIHTTGPGARACPFCPGQEHETPPEVDAERPTGTPPDAPGWVARAFPNKYPAGPRHEVIAEGSTHCEQPADLDVDTWQQCVQLWQRRVQAIERQPGVATAFLFKNVGALAGASIAHSHSQLLGLPELPPRLQLEHACAGRLPYCPWCRALATADDDGRTIARTPAHALIAPDPPKLPWETWLLPIACDDDFLTTDTRSLAQALHALFSAIARGLGQPAFNLWLHRIPGARFHWHFELQPRTGQLAGLELGGDMYINSVPARTAAMHLRAALG